MTIRLKSEDQVKILCADDIYRVMQRILLRQSKIDRNREHLWSISTDTSNKILNIELVSMGSVNRTVVEPMEVFSVPLQKRAVGLIIIHNHPSGELKPSAPDKDLTDQLIQCGLIMQVPVIDHLIITEKTYYSFAENGLLAELANSTRYVPEYKIRERMRKEIERQAVEKGADKKAREIALTMKLKGYDVNEIVELTGLTEATIKRMKKSLSVLCYN